jgi:hypothetical protein
MTRKLRIRTLTPLLLLAAAMVFAASRATAHAQPPGHKGSTTSEPSADSATAEDYFGLKLKVGQKIGNIFSKIASYQGGGVEEHAGRIGGSGLYEVVDASPDRPKFLQHYRLDGVSSDSATVEVRDKGATSCSVDKGKCMKYLDDSGEVFDAFLWSNPTGKIVPGMSWQVQLTVPWELGPVGMETVTVIRTDPANHEVMLKREGSGEGFFDDDEKQMKVKKDGKEFTVDVTPGTTHWVGYSVFREGLTVSDELLETRSLTISSKDFGTSTISERQFTLLNQAPSELL